MSSFCNTTEKILTFGDSLTEGFHRGGFSFHPYSLELQRQIDDLCNQTQQGGGDVKVVVCEHGNSGEFTTSMGDRLAELLGEGGVGPALRQSDSDSDVGGSRDQGVTTWPQGADISPRNNNYYYAVCILAGTNDLSTSDSADTIFKRLEELYEMVLSQRGGKVKESDGDVDTAGGSILVAITIPQAFFQDDKDYIARRSAINEMIKRYCDQRRNTGRVLCVDLEKALPYRNDDNEVDMTHWDDYLHMTPAGYDKFGALVFQTLQDKISDLLLNR